MADMKEVIGKTLKKKPVSSHKMVFDSDQAQLEPIYYWILDFINTVGWETKKITDNFTSSPGSGHFAEMGQRASLMQEKATKILADVNMVIKSVLNLIYDLKEFEIRLEHYDDYNSDDKAAKERGMLALKNLWLDTVDMKKGNGAINVLAGQPGFVTLRDLFYIVNSDKELEKISDKKEGLVNEQVKRVLTPRLGDFWKWVKYSERELRKRMSIEKSYLKAQIETIKLYSSWMKPYLQAAEELRQKGFEGNAALVNAFSTTMFELSLLAKKSEKVPEKFKGYIPKRKYHPILLVNLKYRGHVGQRATQQGDYAYARGGRVEMIFDAFALNEEELKLVEKELEKDDIADSIGLKGDVAAEALEDLKDDLEHFLENDVEEEEKKKKNQDDINPFTALFKLFTGKSEKKKDIKDIKDKKDIKKDDFVEKLLRKSASKSAADGLYLVYDIYKKAHGMASAGKDGFDRG